ncbi:MAG: hypothetical protein COZ80_02320 [Ignavibacteria bacterium CG_4_8_14_3_um_filter_37_9]|nr:DUF494 family protein [Ignavibacteria bacterium]OIO23629.1 MAG: hypothetical protein AUJ54_01365 [Ignavibacteria bacterium CG1_02_37_35]PIP76801.1 MAG: hypothetical protein COW85_12220 [Ignavibacteria bacterium CG22_combo_CG10-13_8_21_14_all_37_15]PIS46102.1 MAG: hypothetical protein COT22_01850 [Ignavibacteria bacterium CG08_land_8_20_14_0_20_37_9]PIX00028.1 MAG: hypothetical protein COZ80_02320 [Ignavibacteria bacterium CG_4_8_14_3_um_filter_37_9]PIX92849.1 MAG: hypothetical protein COZ25
MRNRLAEVLSKLLDGLAKEKSLEQVESKLLKKNKYDKTIVATAYSWIIDKINTNQIGHLTVPAASKGMRIFSEDEMYIIGMSNYNRLLKLFNIGLLTNSDLDGVMEQIFFFPEFPLSEDEMNFLILNSIIDADKLSIPGSRKLLYLSDKIN